MARNNGIVHSAITRQLLERKLKKQISAVSLGDTAMDIQLLTQKVNTVQSSLSTIYSTLAGLVNQLDVFENITQNIQDSLATLCFPATPTPTKVAASKYERNHC